MNFDVCHLFRLVVNHNSRFLDLYIRFFSSKSLCEAVRFWVSNKGNGYPKNSAQFYGTSNMGQVADDDEVQGGLQKTSKRTGALIIHAGVLL